MTKQSEFEDLIHALHRCTTEFNKVTTKYSQPSVFELLQLLQQLNGSIFQYVFQYFELTPEQRAEGCYDIVLATESYKLLREQMSR